MKLVLPVHLVERLKRELRRAGSREIGGVLVAEHTGSATFRLADLSVQRCGGSQAHFVRDPAHSKDFLDEFFSRTGNDYQKFNYVGEWHSHPLFEPVPSQEDLATMKQIVEDPNVGANFAVLMIVSLADRSLLRLSATAFRPSATPIDVAVTIETSDAHQAGWLERVIRFFRS